MKEVQNIPVGQCFVALEGGERTEYRVLKQSYGISTACYADDESECPMLFSCWVLVEEVADPTPPESS